MMWSPAETFPLENLENSLEKINFPINSQHDFSVFTIKMKIPEEKKYLEKWKYPEIS